MKLPIQSQRRFAWLVALAAMAGLAIVALRMATKDRGMLQSASPVREADSLPANDHQSVSVPRSAIAAARRVLAQDPLGSRQHLDELRRVLQTSPSPIASSAIQEILESKTDAATGLELKIGPGGLLTNSPTLRVF